VNGSTPQSGNSSSSASQPAAAGGKGAGGQKGSKAAAKQQQQQQQAPTSKLAAAASAAPFVPGSGGKPGDERVIVNHSSSAYTGLTSTALQSCRTGHMLQQHETCCSCLAPSCWCATAYEYTRLHV
jgi:hypothetical protein